MNPHADHRASRWIKNADNKRSRHQDPARRDEEDEQRHTRRAQPGVLEHESIQRATARLDPAQREEEQSANTSQHAVVDVRRCPSVSVSVGVCKEILC